MGAGSYDGPSCSECGDAFSRKRRQLGYRTCLPCGDQQARIDIERLKGQSAPAYNKGPYMLITNLSMAKDLGR